jgi:PAS domain S-box-containing protein
MASPRLFQRFALYSGIALVVAVGLGLLLARWNANDRARSRAIGEATAVSTRLAHDDLARTAFRWPRPRGAAGADLLDFLDDFFSPATSGHEPARVVLYSPQGYVTYATDRKLIGTLSPDSARIHRAASGPQYAVGNDLQDAFAPVTWTFAPDGVRGVMELEHDYGPIAAEIRQDFVFQAATIALALILLYLAMLPIMRRVTRTLRRGYLERAELAAIVDHSNDAIVAQTPEGVITSWNAGAEGVYGWSAAEAIGRPIEILLPEVRATVPASDSGPGHTTHRRKDGTPVAVSVAISPIRDAKGAFVGSSLIARDVTDVKRLERELREAHREEAVGRLSSGIAHDFSEVLGEIDSAAAHLLLDPASPYELEKIRHATARGSALADQLFAVGGAREASPEIIDLNDAIRAAEPKLVELGGPRIVVSTELEEELGPVYADRDQVAQLIVHLAANARDSMPAGGRLTIQTANVDFARRARGGERQPGHYAMFAVTDTGAALEPEAKERPHEPFYRRNPGGERMALGLAAVCGIVKQSGGTMGVESRPEGGTVVRVYLPRVEARQTAKAAPTARAARG